MPGILKTRNPKPVWFFALATTALTLVACASTMSKILPIGEPVTEERCKAFDLKQMGFADGSIGQRQGEKYEFWRKDCAAFRVTLDREAYDQGYQEGLSQYCSCENGFVAGVKEEFKGLKGQYVMCQSANYKRYVEGHNKGQAQASNQHLAKKINYLKIEYNEPAIQAMATASCAASAQ